MALEQSNSNQPKTKAKSNKSLLQKLQQLQEDSYKVSFKDRMFFTEQLSLLLETGVSLHAALSGLSQQTDNPALRKMIESMMTDISEGRSFSSALSKHPKVFDSTYVNLIAASESGGFMHEVLLQLLEMDEKRDQLKSSLISAFSYPLFLVFFSIAVVVFVLVVVFPKFAEMFGEIYDQLPGSTKFLLAASDVLTQNWGLILLGIGVFVALTLYWLKSSHGKNKMDRFKLYMPGIKTIFIQLYLVQSLRVMSLSLKHGVSVVDTLNACRDVVKNSLYRQFIQRVQYKVEEGAGIASSFSDTPFMPKLVEQMIKTGEETGSLPKVMARVAEHFEKELSRRLDAISKLAEPVMLMVMGLVVGILVSSLILPIFKLSRVVN